MPIPNLVTLRWWQSLFSRSTAALWLLSFSLRAASYVPPVGIPPPEFGINEQHHMYKGQLFDYDQNGEPETPYRDGKYGPYTHYVDSNSPKATDIFNAYGSADKPRMSIPKSLPAGSVVELHGGPYGFHATARGTSNQPVFVRGLGTNAMAVLNAVSGIKDCTYLVVENISVRCPRFPIHQNTHHLAIRHCDFSGVPMPTPGTRGGAVSYTWTDSYWREGEVIDHIVWFQNRIHDNGEYPPSFEAGIHGIGIANGSQRIWVLENEIFRNAEDGIHIFGGGRGGHPHFVYIGRNKFYQDGENAIDVKKSFDVIISENEFWGYRKTHFPKSGSEGPAIVLNDDSPSDRLWIINNRIYDCTAGIRSQSSGNVFIVGNVISDIKHEAGQRLAVSSGSNPGVAIWSTSSTNLHIVNNTIEHVDGGIYIHNGVHLFIYNNLVSRLRETNTFHLALNRGNWNYHIAQNLIFNEGRAPYVKAPRNLGNWAFSQDPRFLGATTGDFRLATNSPAVDVGQVAEVYQIFEKLYGRSIAQDLRGVKRPQGKGWDIGAYETVVDKP